MPRKSKTPSERPDENSPGERAAVLNKIAADKNASLDGLPDNEADYVSNIRKVYASNRQGRMTADEAKAWQRLLQQNLLQNPLLQQTIESWEGKGKEQ